MTQLSKTMICLDCDEVFDAGEHGRCPRCGSEATAPLSFWVLPLERMDIGYSQPMMEGCHGRIH